MRIILIISVNPNLTKKSKYMGCYPSVHTFSHLRKLVLTSELQSSSRF